MLPEPFLRATTEAKVTTNRTSWSADTGYPPTSPDGWYYATLGQGLSSTPFTISFGRDFTKTTAPGCRALIAAVSNSHVRPRNTRRVERVPPLSERWCHVYLPSFDLRSARCADDRRGVSRTRVMRVTRHRRDRAQSQHTNSARPSGRNPIYGLRRISRTPRPSLRRSSARKVTPSA